MTKCANENLKIDFRLSIASVVVLIFSLLSLFKGWKYLSWISIAGIDIYLIAILLTSAVLTDKKKNNYTSGYDAKWLFPSGRVAVIIIPLMALALICSFAGLFLSIDGCNNFTEKLSGPLDSFYFSLVTMTTVGFGDFSPSSDAAKLLVIGEIFSGFLMLFGVFPLLISSISER